METDIKDYIEAGIPALSGCLYPVFTVDLSRPTAAYTFIPISGGHVRQSQLELKIIWSDYDTCKWIEAVACGLMDMEEDTPFVCAGSTRFHSSLAGGGVLFNEGCQMYEDTLYFLIDWRNISGR